MEEERQRMQKAAATDRPTDAVFTLAKQARSLQAAAPIFPPPPASPILRSAFRSYPKNELGRKGEGDSFCTLWPVLVGDPPSRLLFPLLLVVGVDSGDGGG